MLYLITGKPGSGKTLHMMSMLLKRKDLRDRPLYIDGNHSSQFSPVHPSGNASWGITNWWINITAHVGRFSFMVIVSMVKAAVPAKRRRYYRYYYYRGYRGRKK